MYKWHKKLGLIVLIPTILWTLSAMMHPFMSHWFKTELPLKFYSEEKVSFLDKNKELKEVLQLHNIHRVKNVRYVQFEKQAYFQVKLSNDQLRYFAFKDGKELINGDKKYAEFIARAMTGDMKSKVKSIELITDFTAQYKFVNRLLPVWKVSFDRSDDMDIYVETAHSKFATFNDMKRKVFIWIFSNFHNWAFLSFLPKGLQVGLMVLIIGVIFLSAISGIVIYVFHWKFFKNPPKGDKLGWWRKYHRVLGISFSLFTFLFAFSGGYHVTRKLIPDDRKSFLKEPIFEVNEFPDTLQQLKENETNISFLKLNGKTLLQTQIVDFHTKSENFNYYNLTTAEKVEDGNYVYCRELAEKYAKKKGDKMPSKVETEWVTDFTNEYGFVNKRLPVLAFHLKDEQKTSYYIEPATGHLAAYIQNGDRYEGLSFAFLHKFHFLDSLGKDARDGILVFFALIIFVVSLLGLAIFLKKRA